MRVIIACNGSRGDFQPYLAVGLELRARGHEVKYYTSETHRRMAMDSGFACKVSSADMEEYLHSEKCMLAMSKGDFSIVANDLSKNLPLPEPKEAMTSKLKADLREFKPDFMIYNSIGLLHIIDTVAKEVPEMPRISVELQPQAVASQNWKSGGFQRELPDNETPNIMTYLWGIDGSCVDHYLELHKKDADKETILREMETSPTPESLFEMIFEPETLITPRMLGYSAAFWPPEDDWPKTDKLWVIGNLKLTREQQNECTGKGNSFFTSGPDYDACLEFIEKGTPPVYIGWGSMTVYGKHHMTVLAVKALKRAGERGIVLGGWAQLSIDGLEGCEDAQELTAWCKDNVRFVKVMPHELLFPKCKACVHHGGIGTLQASLSSGCPTIITPVFADQYDNATHLTAIECGVTTVRLGLLEAEELGDAIRTVCLNSKFKANAVALSEKMAKESGTRTLVDWMEKFLAEEVQTGNYKKKRMEWKERLYELRKKNCRLTFSQLQAKWQSTLAKRYPTVKAYVGRNMKFMATAADLVGKGKLWVVEAASALARSGEGLKTPEVGRFKKYAFLEEVERDKKGGSRIHVKRLRGRGPEEGWVSNVVNGKDMVCRVKDAQDISTISIQEWTDLFADLNDTDASKPDKK